MPKMSDILPAVKDFFRGFFFEASGLLRLVGAFIVAHILALVEIVAIIISISIDVTHLDHFTWWGLIWYGLYLLTTFVGLGERTWGAAVATCSSVLVGVVLLSFARCSMLTDAIEEYGGSGYILGNFGVHYWPCFRLFVFPPALSAGTRQYVYVRNVSGGQVEGTDTVTGISERFDRSALDSSHLCNYFGLEFVRQAALGFVPLLVYVSWTKPERVYGCNVSGISVLCGTLFMVGLVAVLFFWQYVRPWYRSRPVRFII